MPIDPKVIGSRHVYAGRLFDLQVDELEFPNGVVAQREMIRHPGAVAMLPIDSEGRIMLVTQYRHSAGRRLLELPAGTLEPGEEPAAAVARELQEEIHRKPGNMESMGGFYVAPGYCDEYIHLFLCTDLEESVLAGDEDEDIEVETLDRSEALAAIDDGRISDAKSIIGLLKWMRAG